ncbi:DUF6525 family protein [Pseudogemmobacter hezensis]|uniref:DUF6525 family protein n=1 Tax=Pseudogemmobacter hezensis TaxID=2737662 RepID=UPI0015520DCD|nr:DUF6525 family protein [Pseudogemmobacter hezensis]
MGRNLVTSLRCRARARPMDRFDRLPPELRHWLARAALPWSPQSAARLWQKALREAAGDRVAALSRLDRAEARLLARDGRQVWGADYPQAALGKPG